MKNVPLLRKVLEHIEDQVAADRAPNNGWRTKVGDWNQGFWFDHEKPIEELNTFRVQHNGQYYTVAEAEQDCGTTGCVAGHAAAISGLLPAKSDLWDMSRQWGALYDPATGQISNVAKKAGELLGLTHAERDALFEGSNRLHRVRDLLKQYIAEGEKEEARG